MSERSGIEIDYCPTCRGVWLDRGELDKIIERLAHGQPRPTRRSSRPPQHQQPPGAAAADEQRSYQQQSYRAAEASEDERA